MPDLPTLQTLQTLTYLDLMGRWGSCLSRRLLSVNQVSTGQLWAVRLCYPCKVRWQVSADSRNRGEAGGAQDPLTAEGPP